MQGAASVIFVWCILAVTLWPAHGADLSKSTCSVTEVNSTFCGALTPQSICHTTGSKADANVLYSESDYDWKKSDKYKLDMCPSDPSSVLTPSSKKEYCETWGCHSSEDCAKASLPLCYSYCLHCGFGGEHCRTQIYQGKVAPQGKPCSNQGWTPPSTNGSDEDWTYFWIGSAGAAAILFSCVALPLAIWLYIRYSERLHWRPIFLQPSYEVHGEAEGEGRRRRRGGFEDEDADDDYPMRELSSKTHHGGDMVDLDVVDDDEDELSRVI